MCEVLERKKSILLGLTAVNHEVVCETISDSGELTGEQAGEIRTRLTAHGWDMIALIADISEVTDDVALVTITESVMTCLDTANKLIAELVLTTIA